MSILTVMTDDVPKTTEQFLSTVGRVDFQKETGFSAQRVQRAKDENVFPANWIWKVRDFCKARMMPTPEHLFRGHPNSAPKSPEPT